jgi:hypothetical protein
MEVFYHIPWGSPLGIGLFIFLMSSGAGILFWGVSHFNKAIKRKKNLATCQTGKTSRAASPDTK